MEVKENDEVIDSTPQLDHAIPNNSGNIYISTPNNQNYLGQTGNPIAYQRYLMEMQKRRKEHQQRRQDPSLLQRFQNVLIDTGKYLTNVLG